MSTLGLEESLYNGIGEDDALGGEDGMKTSSIGVDNVEEDAQITGLDNGVWDGGGDRQSTESLVILSRLDPLVCVRFSSVELECILV